MLIRGPIRSFNMEQLEKIHHEVCNNHITCRIILEDGRSEDICPFYIPGLCPLYTAIGLDPDSASVKYFFTWVCEQEGIDI